MAGRLFAWATMLAGLLACRVAADSHTHNVHFVGDGAPEARPSLAAAAARRLAPGATTKVSFGQVARSGEFPYAVAFAMCTALPDEPLECGGACSGSLIAPDVVLTAGHCLKMKRDGEWFWMPWNDVRVNATNLLAPTGPGRRGGIKVSYRAAVVHEKFEYDANDEYDVGLLFLTKPVAGVAPVRLAAADLAVAPWRALTVAGFGYTEGEKDANPYLRSASVAHVPYRRCGELAPWGGVVPFDPNAKTLMCAGYVSTDSDACGGDSGGPLVIWDKNPAKHVQVGITHAGKPCGSVRHPIGSYAKVSVLRSWIGRQIRSTRAALAARGAQ